MEITAIEKDKNKISIYVNEKFSFSLPEDEYIRLNLYEKKSITEEEIIYIKEDVSLRLAKATAVKFVSLKLRTEKEVRLKLEDSGFETDIIDSTIDQLNNMGYINDRMYAQKYISDRNKLKPKSKRLLKYELSIRGISSDLIDEAINGLDIDEIAIAEGLIRKRFGKYDLNDEKVIIKIKSFLNGRGFDIGTIECAIRSVNNK